MSILKKLLITGLCVCSLSAYAYAETTLPVISGEQTTLISTNNDIKDFYFNNVKTENSIITVEEKSMVPITQICDLFDLNLEYYEDSECYILKNQFTTLVIYMNNPYTIVNEGGYYTTVAPTTVDDTDYVSLDVVIEAFGATSDISENIIRIDYNLPIKTLTYNNKEIELVNHGVVVDNKVMLSVNELADILKISKFEYFKDSDCFILNNGLTNLCIYMNNPYTIVGDFGYNTSVKPIYINNTAYVCADVVLEAFDAKSSFDDTLNIEYIPPITSVIMNGKTKKISTPGIVKDNKVMLSLDTMKDLMRLSYEYYSDNNCYVIKNRKKNQILTIYMDNPYTIVGNDGYNTAVAPTIINGTAYVCADVVLEAFGVKYTISEKDSIYSLSFNYNPYTWEENFVINAGKSSSTNYLIWVSKSNFRVYIFTGSKGDWNLLKSYPCSIGAPSTPTCEGTYKFYERVPLWDYGSYYVGPVMRFNGGYALHSTLEYYSGGSYDGRLGYMISHGCVRLAPAAIQWMYNNIPLYTTVYITG